MRTCAVRHPIFSDSTGFDIEAIDDLLGEILREECSSGRTSRPYSFRRYKNMLCEANYACLSFRNTQCRLVVDNHMKTVFPNTAIRLMHESAIGGHDQWLPRCRSNIQSINQSINLLFHLRHIFSNTYYT